MSSDSIVIVGGGHAGAQLCGALAEAGAGPRVQLVCNEEALPYQRPPLSKSFLKNPAETLQPHRAEAWYADAQITVHRSDAVRRIDREHRRVTLASGRQIEYGQLVLATGAKPRRLPHLHESLANVRVLRSAADAEQLRSLLASTRRLCVLGGGFIGLEVAATARGLGLEVEVLESAPRLLARSVSPTIAEHVQATHAASGIALRLGVRVGEFEIEGDRLVALQVDGLRQPVELLVLGIGAAPDTELAHQAGLEVDNGIVVDAAMRTSDPSILAIGDCCNFPDARSGRRHRLESVQNASDQAKVAAATLLGREAAYGALPWFWSEQGALRLQMAGLTPAESTVHRRPGANAASFSLFHYVGDRLASVESVNAAMDHIMSRKILEAGKSPAPAQVIDPAVALKTLV
jgi:3-phenylpropionate/trans-cinnamate dioxygenase ferredoxin reductase subunit